MLPSCIWHSFLFSNLGTQLYLEIGASGRRPCTVVTNIVVTRAGSITGVLGRLNSHPTSHWYPDDIWRHSAVLGNEAWTKEERNPRRQLRAESMGWPSFQLTRLKMSVHAFGISMFTKIMDIMIDCDASFVIFTVCLYCRLVCFNYHRLNGSQA